MFTSERRDRIRQLISVSHKVDVSDLSEQFHVSEVTIRKDLIFLEKCGVLIRTHGGAVAKDAPPAASVSPYSPGPADGRKLLSIASVVADSIDDAEYIYLGCGPVCTAIAAELAKKDHLTVLTNNVTALCLLAQNSNLHLISPPGVCSSKNGEFSLTGAETLDFLQSKYVDKAVLSPDSANFRQGYCLHESELCEIYKCVVDHADHVVLAVTGDSFGKNAFAPLGSLTAFSKVFTDGAIPDEYTEFFAANGVQLYTAFDLKGLKVNETSED